MAGLLVLSFYLAMPTSSGHFACPEVDSSTPESLCLLTGCPSASLTNRHLHSPRLWLLAGMVHLEFDRDVGEWFPMSTIPCGHPTIPYGHPYHPIWSSSQPSPFSNPSLATRVGHKAHLNGPGLNFASNIDHNLERSHPCSYTQLPHMHTCQTERWCHETCSSTTSWKLFKGNPMGQFWKVKQASLIMR